MLSCNSQRCVHVQSVKRDLLKVGEPFVDPAGPHPPPPPAVPAPPNLPAAGITVVTTADELRAASTNLTQDIEIQAHLDLRGLRRVADPDAPDGGPQSESLLFVRNMARSIRVSPLHPPSTSHTTIRAFQVHQPT